MDVHPNILKALLVIIQILQLSWISGYRKWIGLAVKITRENTNVYLGPTLIAAAEPIPIKNVVQSNSVGADYIVFGSN